MLQGRRPGLIQTLLALWSVRMSVEFPYVFQTSFFFDSGQLNIDM